MVVPTVLCVDMPGAWFLDRLAVVEALSPVLKFARLVFASAY
jgi:hypothetical protein